jgi:SAM-dependent methyltransferase
MSAAELAELEARIHDAEYRDGIARPIDVAQWWRRNDHCYKPGTYHRGYRKRRLMELVGVTSLKGKKVLEIGCGTGELSVFMALHGAKVSGIDLSEVGIAKAKALAAINGVERQCDFSVQDASQMTFADNSYDFVIYNAVLHHALKYPNVREETWRVLKAGGICAFAEGIRSNPIYRAARSVKRAMRPEQIKGDIDIGIPDLELFLSGYENKIIETFCLALGIKELIGRNNNNNLMRRSFFFILTYIDKCLLASMPFLNAYCSEVVGIGRKPLGVTAGG